MGINYVHEKMLSNNELLRERIEYCFVKYKTEMMQLESIKMYEYASQISVVNKIYTLMAQQDWFEEDEAACLLRFENPLMMLASEWQTFQTLNGVDFEDFVSELMAVPELEKENSIDYANALAQELSDDMPVLVSVLTDLIAMSEKLFAYIESQEYCNCGKGGGFWSNG